ncbi:hypothetical protein GIB67_007086 [Kingdonia uniflora]|uniref:Uncharacterized protein n=1 Tax=Kingdonia uniflora TaxID=39325 RepID=A0A7J7NZQ0_9MAGN|nr:hypothetical protein GIB67_007086 [Kingdonia uniflora]
MELPDGVLCKILYILVLSQVFTVVFALLYVVGFIKAILFCPFVLIVIGFGNFIFIIGLCPLHLFWTAYCIAKSKKFGPFMKCGLIITLPIPIALWTVVEVVGTLGMIIWYGFAWPVMETFKAISRPGIKNKLHGCLLAGTWSSLTGACTVVRDFGDFSFHSYFSVMDEWLEAKEDKKPLELKVKGLADSSPQSSDPEMLISKLLTSLEFQKVMFLSLNLLA